MSGFLKRELFAAMIFMALPLSMMQSHPLSKHRWKQRVLLVFSPQDQPDQAQEQITIMGVGSPDWDDRKLALYDITGEGGMGPDGYITVAASRELRKAYGVALGEFLVVLVGLDGKEKRRGFSPIPQAEIFGLIDSMPMRQTEIEGKKTHDP